MASDRWLDAARFLGEVCPNVFDAALDLSDEDCHVLRDVRCHPFGEGIVWKFGALHLISDAPTATAKTSVFPLHPESVFLASLIAEGGDGKRFLDVGTGSGVLAISAAKRGWDVSAVDINPRAVTVAAINALINHASVDVRIGDLTGKFEDASVDVCFANLPFEPTPPNAVSYMFADGGPTGLNLIARLLDDLPRVLAPGGIALVPAFALIESRGSQLAELLEQSVKLDRLLLELSDELEVSSLFVRFPNAIAKGYLKELAKKNMNTMKVELACLRKPADSRNGLNYGTSRLIRASSNWLRPIAARDLGRPAQV